MNLKMNNSHWQVPDGFELRSGDHVEIFLDGCWMQGEINYRGPGQYQAWLKNGLVLEITESLVIRILNRDLTRLSKNTEKDHP